MKKSVRVAAGAALAVVAIALSACSGSSSGSTSTSGRSELLTIASQAAPTSLNPVLTPVSNVVAFAYDPVIYKANDGSYLPDLATDWGYVGTGNTVFEFTIRDGVTFQQGGELTAQTAAASLQYFLDTPNSNALSVGKIASVEAVDDDTVRITYSEPFPNAVESLTQYYGFGLLIGPNGVADPDSLETASDGAGQYSLDAADTVSGSTVAFTANDSYFEQDAIKFDEVKIQILADANARLSALKSGQVDIAQQMPLAQVGASAIEGQQTITGYTTWSSVQFLNTTSGPLASADVRKAINLAIDRDSLVQNFYSGYAVAQEQTAPTGQVGYVSDLDDSYPYDLDQVKSLLASAGYADGVTFTLYSAGTVDAGGLLGQAVTDALASAGITVELTVGTGNFQSILNDINSGEYDAVIYPMFASDLYTLVTQSIVQPGTLLNPTGVEDPKVTELVQEAASAADSDAFAAALEELDEYLNEISFSVPLATIQTIDLASEDVVLPSDTYTVPQPNIVAPTADLAVSKSS
ncbi:MAG: ABC transporter substrate-binding protein [Microbacterium sp.]|uniref:ABC transporter substrate-binding protein n=1 Tax=Microbacterium sp. TaxID=51671 RepID=UPI0039E4D4C4